MNSGAATVATGPGLPRVTPPASAPSPDAPPAAAQPRAASGGPDVVGLPTGTARLVATWMASLAAVTTAWLLGSPVITPDVVFLFGIAALLLFLAVRLGLRAQLVLGLALGCGLLFALLSVAGFGLLLLAVLGGAALFIVLVHRARVALSKGIMLIAFALLCGMTWAAPAAMGIAMLLGAPTDVGLAIMVAAATWTFSHAGRRVRLRSGARLTVVRDAVFQVLAMTTVSLAALWLGTTTETAVSRWAVGTPFESLAPSAGWFVLILTLLALAWSAIGLPRRLVRAQMRGRIEARVTGESLLFVTFACAGALLSWRWDENTVLGRACVVALAAGAAYVVVRVRYATPLPLPNYPLWIIPVDETAAVLRAASANAAEWRVGQVTVLAKPGDAPRFAGEHLRAADTIGEGDSLFPTRPVHLQDWLDAQPTAWRSLPLRELYASPDLWARVLADVTPDTPVIALMSGATATLQHVLKNDPPSPLRASSVVGVLLPVSQATAMQLKLLAVGSVGDGLVLSGRAAIRARLRELRPVKASVRVRHIVLLCASADLELAEDLASRIHGETDAEGRVVECWVSAQQRGTAAMLRLLRLPGNVWRHAMWFGLEMFESSDPRPGRRLYSALLRRILATGWKVDFEVVVIESVRPGAVLPIGTLSGLTDPDAVVPVIAIRRASAMGTLTYPDSIYRGQIVLPDGRGQDAAVAHVIQKLLAGDVQALTTSVPGPATVPPVHAALESAVASASPSHLESESRETTSEAIHTEETDETESHPTIHPAPPFFRRQVVIGAAIASIVLLIAWLEYRLPSTVDSTAASAPPLQHGDAVSSAAFSTDGTRVVTASRDKTARVWDARTGQPVGAPLQHGDAVSSAVFSADGTRVVTASQDNTARVWDARTGQPVGAPLQHGDAVSSAVFSADGTRVVTASEDNTARVWDARTGQPVGAPLQHGDAVSSAAFSTDGTRVVTASRDKTARVWDARTGQPVGASLQHGDAVSSAAFSTDGTRVVTASRDKTARVWDARTGQPVGAPLQHGDAVSSAAFSADGTRVVTASGDKTARVWDARTGQPVGAPLQHGATVSSAVFSADGTRVVTGSEDNTARVWDVRTGQPVGAPLQHGNAVSSAAFSVDGTHVVTASRDKTARVWDAPMGQPVGAVDAVGRAAIAEALRLRDLKDYTEMVDVLTRALATERNEQLRVVMLRDRAYANKQRGRWTDSMTDLGAVLAIAPDDRRTLEDRAFLELFTRDPDAALDDYERLGSPAVALNRVRELITPTQSSDLFVYLPVGTVNGPAVMPDTMQRLSGKWPRVNLRFWWYPIVANEVRYTQDADEAEAKVLVSALREQGLKVGDPIRLSGAAKRTRRIEVWLVERKAITQSPPSVRRPPVTSKLPSKEPPLVVKEPPPQYKK